MLLPTAVQIARVPATLLRYQDGNLWYRVIWKDDEGPGVHNFDFPVPVDRPDLCEIMDDAAIALKIFDDKNENSNRVAERLHKAVVEAKVGGAGEGEFLPEMKGIQLLRWARKHLEMLKRSEQDAALDELARLTEEYGGYDKEDTCE